MVKQTAGATIGGGCLMMFLCCGGCQLIGLFAPRPKPIPVLTATDTEMPEETATVAIDATSPQETTVDTVAIEKIFNEEMIAYEQAVADYENAVALKEAATKDLAETIAELASHNESRPTPVTHSARKWRTLIGDHETLATYVESDKDSVKLLKPGTAEPISVPIEKLVAENRVFIQSLAKKLLTYNDDHAKWTSKQSELLEAKRTLEESLELAAGEPSKRPTRDDVASKVIADRIAAAKVEEERRRAEKLKELELLREERANAAIAEVRSQRESFETFMALVNSDEATRLLISSVRQDGDTLIVTVENLWHIRAYQIRLQDAQALWDIWARLRHPKNPDKARLKLVDGRGNEVGGSRVWAGSLIWVSD